MSPTQAQVLIAIDECSPDDLIRGLKIAIVAYGIKMDRRAMLKAADVRQMEARAVGFARALLNISAGSLPP